MKKFPKTARIMLKIIREPLAGVLRSISPELKSSPPLLLQGMELFPVELISILWNGSLFVMLTNVGKF